MTFKWDERKRNSNLRKHGIDFVGCEAIFAGKRKTMIDDRADYGEERFVTFGLLSDLWWPWFTPKRPTRFG